MQRFLILSAFAALLSGPAGAHEVGGEKVEVVLGQNLPDVPGKKALMATVTFAPGQESEPHKHPGSVLVYAREGTIQTQMADGPLTTYTQGQRWYEPPLVPHRVARNASEAAPAKLLVVILGGEKDPPKLALTP